MRHPRKPSRPSGRRIREEKGDASTKVLHRTIVVCAIGLLAVLAFAISPRKAVAPGAAKATNRTDAKAPSATFDRQSLSTKYR